MFDHSPGDNGRKNYKYRESDIQYDVQNSCEGSSRDSSSSVDENIYSGKSCYKHREYPRSGAIEGSSVEHLSYGMSNCPREETVDLLKRQIFKGNRHHHANYPRDNSKINLAELKSFTKYPSDHANYLHDHSYSLLGIGITP